MGDGLDGLHHLRRHQEVAGPGLYAGTGPAGLVLTPPQQTMLVLGPPRSGKSTTLVAPNVLAAPGAVIATSTKPELLAWTAGARAALGGRCWLFDPSGTTPTPPGVRRLRWSPVASAGTWDGALLAARSLTGAARPGPRTGEGGHWLERAEAVLAPLLHAAALGGRTMRDVQRWVLRQDLGEPAALLVGRGIHPAADVVAGLQATHERELSGIWSTTAGVLAAYRSSAALDAADGCDLDPADLAATTDTVYVCAPAREQELLAPITVTFVEAAVAGAYRLARDRPAGARPLTLVLDEVANIAPLPSLPGLVAEGAGQGVSTVACLQDLAQARQRWGPIADGFASLFGTKIALPGIGDLGTLELLSRLAGEVDVPTRSVSRGPWWSTQRAPQVSWSARRLRRLPVDDVHHQAPGTALLVVGPRAPARVTLVPWWGVAPFAEAQGVGLPPPTPTPSPSPPPPPSPSPSPSPRASAAPAAPPPVASRRPVHEPEVPGHGTAPW